MGRRAFHFKKRYYMNQTKINAMLATPEAQNIFRRYKISGSGMTAVRAGYDKSGSQFMVDLVKAISAKSNISGFTGEVEGPPTMEEYLVASQFTSEGNGWSWWDNFLTYMGKTGSVVTAFKNIFTGSSPEDEAAEKEEQKKEQKRSNIIWIVAVVVVLGIVALLVFKKKE